MQLSEHFTLEEMTQSQIGARHGIDNTPSDQEIDNLKRVCAMLEKVRALVGKPITVTSGYRAEAINSLLGSKNTSQHRLGCAADIKVAGMPIKQLFDAIIQSDIEYDQIILEYDAWVHISVPNTANDFCRHSKLVIDKSGTRAYS